MRGDPKLIEGYSKQFNEMHCTLALVEELQTSGVVVRVAAVGFTKWTCYGLVVNSEYSEYKALTQHGTHDECI